MNSKEKGFSIIIVILLVIGILGIIGGAFLYFNKSNDIQITPDPTLNKVVKSPFENLLDEKALGVQGEDCGENMKCIIENSINCTQSHVMYNANIDSFGVKETVSTFLEITAEQPGKCILSLRIDKIALELPEGVSQEIVSEQKDIYKKMEGREGECTFNTTDLTTLLTNWEKGNSNTGTVSCKLSPQGNECKTEGGDFAPATCTGTYFNYTL